ncbi:transglycosylase [Rhodomicrobium udaipurense JA643]|uniref:GlsB/YeaQ/YmgE family stress response membrane protein n=1 Tax=Rhodomicrobium udaipurense TaxID=1202716 RepID=A0A8I1GIC6_9HYPH|nr:GlsB/YeaQ/YmgE family stress response membrane protein [Rhodomicrobium udaipurense]KAI94431.1 transglycosylase [Rhodomicrobium udaipurense JA643]MBJ7543862.1 GlsB/YeaQ/YmgE family stress response membrane protein [Rhodomicrobium udaipurense]
MSFSLPQIFVWVVIGIAGGSLAGILVTRERRGFGFWPNLGLGLLGAIVGGVLFRMFNLLPNLENVAVSMRDIVSALIGSLLVLALLWAYHRNRAV